MIWQVPNATMANCQCQQEDDMGYEANNELANIEGKTKEEARIAGRDRIETMMR